MPTANLASFMNKFYSERCGAEKRGPAVASLRAPGGVRPVKVKLLRRGKHLLIVGNSDFAFEPGSGLDRGPGPARRATRSMTKLVDCYSPFARPLFAFAAAQPATVARSVIECWKLH